MSTLGCTILCIIIFGGGLIYVSNNYNWKDRKDIDELCQKNRRKR